MEIQNNVCDPCLTFKDYKVKLIFVYQFVI